MASKINTNDYMYSSARIRAIENSLIGAEKMRTLSEASNFDDAVGKLSEYGIEVIHRDDGEVDIEETLLKVYTDACSLIESMVPNPEILKFLRYPYDCNNIKACIKCHARRIEPDGMLYDCGTVRAEYAKGIISGEVSEYPENMRRAVGEAIEVYSKNKNPQSIDLILDRACYADMLDCAVSSRCQLAIELVKTKIDFTNILTCVRLLRMKMGEVGKLLLENAVLFGGDIKPEFYLNAYDNGEEFLCSELAFSKYGKFITCICENPDSLSGVEKYADDVYMEMAREAKKVQFGPEVAIGYLTALEYQVKNLRIILDAKKTGKSTDETNHRLRYGYV